MSSLKCVVRTECGEDALMCPLCNTKPLFQSIQSLLTD